jgi:glucosamine-6-phosphate deaminase
MEVAIFKTADEASRAAACLIGRSLKEKSSGAVLGLATGQTPLGTYEELVKMHKAAKISFRNVTAFNLDEYVGLESSDPRSYRTYMRENLFSKVDIDTARCFIPDGSTRDPRAECAAYEEKIRKAGGIDLQLLGLGQDGHIGFNEPSSSLSSRTRLKTLTHVTRAANAANFGGSEKVPQHVLTMGLGTIIEARHCVLIAMGANKSDAVQKMVEGPMSAMLPASILQMHPRCTVILDEAAASGLAKQNYYREVFAGKPAWQRWDLPLD